MNEPDITTFRPLPVPHRFKTKEAGLAFMEKGDLTGALIPGIEGYEDAPFEVGTVLNRPVVELATNREEIRKSLKESRNRHTVRVRSHLP